MTIFQTKAFRTIQKVQEKPTIDDRRTTYL